MLREPIIDSFWRGFSTATFIGVKQIFMTTSFCNCPWYFGSPFSIFVCELEHNRNWMVDTLLFIILACFFSFK